MEEDHLEEERKDSSVYELRSNVISKPQISTDNLTTIFLSYLEDEEEKSQTIQ